MRCCSTPWPGCAVPGCCGSSAATRNPAELEWIVERTGIGHRVDVAGRRTHIDLPTDYAWADVLVVPSFGDAGGDG